MVARFLAFECIRARCMLNDLGLSPWMPGEWLPFALRVGGYFGKPRIRLSSSAFSLIVLLFSLRICAIIFVMLIDSLPETGRLTMDLLCLLFSKLGEAKPFPMAGLEFGANFAGAS